MPHDNAPGGRRPAPEAAAVGAFLRALADRVECDRAFGREVAALLEESGLLRAHAAKQETRANARPPAAGATVDRAASGASAPLPDPYVVLRQEGETGLRARLGTTEIAGLRQIVRAHRLDPARISARWMNRERLVELIVEQVCARADHGKAFARV